MKTESILLSIVALCVSVFLAGCAGGSAAPQQQQIAPAPTITSLSPSSATAGGPQFTLTVNGTNFVSGAVVTWNGNSRATTFVSSTQLSATILSSDIAGVGTVIVNVVNPAPNNSFQSNGMTFAINAPPGPTITSLSPPSAVAGGPGFTLTVNGTNFVSGAAVVWGPIGALPTTFVNSTQLTAAVPASAITTAGDPAVWVNNNNGTGSATVPFEIDNPQPVISSLSPSNVQAGAAPFMLAVNGSGFVTGAGVQWNGSPRLTSVASGTQLTAAIPASDVGNQGSAQITVVNPAPSPGPSSPATFTIAPLTSNPAPVISKLSDTSVPANWPGFPLTIDGTGFVAATTGQWNGANRPSTAVSSTQLKTAISLNDLAQPGAVQVNVFNPLPGGGISNLLGFTVNPVAPRAFGAIERSSLATDLTESNGNSSSPSISADGRFVVFLSGATNLVPGGTNGATQVFLRDTCLGAPTGCVPKVALASVANDGVTQADADTFDATISANGRYVAFSSTATNLGDTSGNENVLVHDTCFGASGSCAPNTTQVSANGMVSYGPSLSADGRYVAFNTGDALDCDPYSCFDFVTVVRDTCAGAPSTCTPNTSQVSIAPTTLTVPGAPAISADGRFVVFEEASSGQVGVFIADTCVGAPPPPAPQCRPGVGPISGLLFGGHSIGGMGRFVTGVNQLPSNTTRDVFVWDNCFGAPAGCTPSTTQVSLTNDGSQPNSSSSSGGISADGRYVVFVSDATNMVVPNDNNPFPKVFLRDTCFGTVGCTPSTTLLSLALDGMPANNQSAAPMLSGDSHYVVFSSLADNLAPGDTNQVSDVFVGRTNVK